MHLRCRQAGRAGMALPDIRHIGVPAAIWQIIQKLAMTGKEGTG